MRSYSLVDQLDPSTPRLLDKRLESWERMQRAEEAHWYFEHLSARRHEFELTARDFCTLDRWIEKVFAQPIGSGYGAAGLAFGGALYPRDLIVNDPGLVIYCDHRADLNYTIATGVSAIGDMLGPSAGYALSQPTGTRQPGHNLTGINSRPAVVFDASDDYLEYATGHAAAVFGGDDKAFATYTVCMLTDLSGTKFSHLWGVGHSSGGNTFHGAWIGTSTPRFSSERRGDGTTTIITNGGATPVPANNVPYWIELYFTGKAVTIIVNGTTSVNAVAQDTPPLTVNRSAIHGVPQASVFMSTAMLRLGQQFMLSREPNALTKALLTAYKVRFWGF